MLLLKQRFFLVCMKDYDRNTQRCVGFLLESLPSFDLRLR